MPSLPWFPFYVDDFMASPKVRRMDAESVGIYLLLLIEQWQSGPIPHGSEEELAAIMRTHCDRICAVLESCFASASDGWVNERLADIYEQQIAKSEQARDAAKSRWGNKKRRHASAKRPHMRPQSERNANQNQIQNQKTLSGESVARAREGSVWDDLDEITVKSIRGNYGGPDREGMDATIWKDANGVDRERCLEIAALRWYGEGHARFNGKLFRRILQTVIAEQKQAGGEELVW